MSDFKFVSHKKKKKKKGNREKPEENSLLFFESLKYKTLLAQEHVSTSEVFKSIRAHILSSLNELKRPGISDIVCYGLGNISDDQNVRYQFGLVLELKKYFGSELFLYDPVFKQIEKDLMINLNCSLIEINECGRRKTTGTTLFFLPHCPHELLNNLIGANWGPNLCDAIIISNSVNEVCSTLPDKKLKEDLPFVLKVFPFVTEMEVHNSFKPVGAFNDLSVHYFLEEKCKDLCDDVTLEVANISQSFGELVVQ